MNLILRFAVSIWIGILSSVIVNFVALEYIWNFHAYNSRFAAIFFALGSLLAPRGFEAQALVIPLNVLAFGVFFSVATFLLLGRRTAT
jgi:hypothetical protein